MTNKIFTLDHYLKIHGTNDSNDIAGLMILANVDTTTVHTVIKNTIESKLHKENNT